MAAPHRKSTKGGLGPRYYHSDQLGSARLMTDSGGNQAWSATYLPFGQEWNPQSTTNHYKFTGQERDAESGLDHFGARYYSSQFGRFLTPDPAGTSATCLFNPQTQDRYTYVTNNPVNETDPTGLCGDGDNSDCGGIGITIPFFPGGGGAAPPALPTPHPVFSFSFPFEALDQGQNGNRGPIRNCVLVAGINRRLGCVYICETVVPGDPDSPYVGTFSFWCLKKGSRKANFSCPSSISYEKGHPPADLCD